MGSNILTQFILDSFLPWSHKEGRYSAHQRNIWKSCHETWHLNIMLSKILPLIKPILNNARVIWTKYNFRVYPLSEYTFLSSLEPLGLQSSRKYACKNPIQTHLESSRPWKSMEATKMSNTESLFYHKVTSMVQKTQDSTLGAGFSYPNLTPIQRNTNGLLSYHLRVLCVWKATTNLGSSEHSTTIL